MMMDSSSSSLSSSRRRWRQSRTGTAVVVAAALLLSTTAWLSLVLSGTSGRCWERFRNMEKNRPSSSSSSSLIKWRNNHSFTSTITTTTTTTVVPKKAAPTPRSPKPLVICEGKLRLEHIVFGIAGSSQLWNRRKELLRLWWRPNEMRGHIWLDEHVDWDQSLPPIMISDDTSRFRYTNPTGHPSGLRISRILSESFRLGLPDVRWFVLGDDDTIFNADNLVDVLSKYDPSQMVYIGGPSESHSANTYFSHSMAYGGGGIAISYPLADSLSLILDDCLDRYHSLYGSDDRLHACISELGVPLTREHGFHQWDIRGNAHGLLSSHPVAPFISIHHVEAVEPFYPGLSSLESLKLLTKAMKVDPMSFLQRSICYDHANQLSFSVSVGYVIQVFPNVVLPRILERSEKTYSAWNGITHRNEFDFDTRDPQKSVCKQPILFFFNDVARQKNITLGLYRRSRLNDHLKRKVFCFPHSTPLPLVQNIQVLVQPLKKNWSLAPRRLCCKLNQSSDENLTVSVGQCDNGSLGSFIDSV